MSASSQEQPLSLPERPRIIYAGQEKDFTLWDKHKDILGLLYLTKNLALKKVKHRMEVEHGFPVLPLNDYEIVLRDHFQFRKNIRSSDWSSIRHRIEKRKSAGKTSNVYLCGQLMPPSKTKKGISRYGHKGVSKPQVRHAFSTLLPENITIRTPSPQPRPHAAPPIAHACETVIREPFEMGKAITTQFCSFSGVDIFKTIDQNARLELVNAIRLHSPFSKFLVLLRDMFYPIETTGNKFSATYNHQGNLVPGLSSSSARAKPGVMLHVSIPDTTDLGAVVSLENMSKLGPHGSHLFASLSHSLSIDEAFTPNLFSQVSFMLSNRLDVETTLARRLLDWVGISAELTIMKSFFSIESHTVAAVWEALLETSRGLHHQPAFEILVEVSLLINRLEWIARKFESILSSAISFRATRTIERLFNSGASPGNIDFGFYDLFSPLGSAAMSAHPDVIKILIENGADVNLQSIHGKEGILGNFVDTPLFILVAEPWVRKISNDADIVHCIRLLLDAGADVDVECRMVRHFRAKHDDSDSDDESLHNSQALNRMVSLGWYHSRPTWLTDSAWFELGAGHEMVHACMDKSDRVRHSITVPGIITQARAGLASLNTYLQSRQFPSSANDRVLLLEIAISRAADLGFSETVTCLLQFGVDPNVGALDCSTVNWDPAAGALRHRHYDVLQILRENGANISVQQIIEQELSQHDFDELLLVELSDIDILANAGHLILAFLKHADQENFTVCAKMCDLMWSKGAPVDIRGDDERDPLHFAIFQGCCLDMCKYLVDRGYKVHCNPSNSTGTKTPSTMLQDAIEHTHSRYKENSEEVVNFLLAHGASIGFPDESESLLDAIFGRYRKFRIRPKIHDGFPPWRPIWKRLLCIFEKLIDLGAFDDTYSKRGSSWDESILELLIRVKQTSDTLIFRVIEATTDVDQHAPLAAAFHHNREAVAERLPSRGAKVNHPRKFGFLSVFGEACGSSCSEAMIERLIELGAEVNDPPGSKPDNMSPLQQAASKGRINVVCLLIKHGAEINAVWECLNASGAMHRYTALDLAAEHGRLDMVQLLRDVGGRSAIPGTTGVEGAITRAEEKGCYSVADFLRSGH